MHARRARMRLGCRIRTGRQSESVCRLGIIQKVIWSELMKYSDFDIWLGIELTREAGDGPARLFSHFLTVAELLISDLYCAHNRPKC